MRPKDFAKPSPGYLTDIADGYSAFVPNLLPPAFSCESEVIVGNDAAMLALGELRATIPYMPNPELITYPFLRREAILSSKIEGTHTGLEQLYLFEAETPDGGTPGDSDALRDAREVHNYVVALEHGLERLKAVPICNRLLRDMHDRLLSGATRDRGLGKNPGHFRQEQVYIGSLEIDTARYVPPPPDKIEELMKNLEEYIHREPKYHPALVRIAIAHYQFEAIHPFMDGNGRIGRLLISLLLSSWGVLPQPLLYLSAFFERNKDEYLHRLWHVSCDNDWIGWVQFFLRGVHEEAQDATQRARELLDLREQYRQQLQRRKGPGSALTLVDFLFRSPFLTITEAAEVLSLSYNSGKKNVEKLVDAGILHEYGDRAWNRIYYAKPILDVLS